MKIIKGTAQSEHLIGSTQSDLMYGYDGNDTLEGGISNDTLIGGIGADKMLGGKGNDVYYVDNVNDTIIENLNEGKDTVYSSVSYTLSDNIENLILTGKDNLVAYANNQGCMILGNLGNDTLYGGTGNDIFFRADNLNYVEHIEGSSGSNSMYGGRGNDTYLINDPGDKVIEYANEGYDTVYTTLKNYTLPANVENGNIIIVGNKNLYGNELNNSLQGNCSNNCIDGGAGNDTIYGGGYGKDTLCGGDGDDKIAASSSGCILSGDNGNDTLIGDHGNDTMYGGTGNDTYAGFKQTFGDQDFGFGHDVIDDYKSFNNNLSGHSGYDTLDFRNFVLKEVRISANDMDNDGKLDGLYINCGKYGSLQINHYFNDSSNKVSLSHQGLGCIEDIWFYNNIHMHFDDIQHLLS